MADCRGRAEAISVAAIEALFASVNPSVSQGKDLQEALTKAIDAVASMPERSSSVRRALYPSVKQVFGRMEETGSGVPRFEVDGLKGLLFGPDAEVEAIRLLRADAIVAACRASSWLAGEVRSEVERLGGEERSKPVLDRLRLCATAEG